MARHSSRKSVGRYDGARKGVFTPPDLPAEGRSLKGKRDVVHANVEDPMQADKRVRVAVNRRVSILEDQRARGFISEAAYRLGRQVEEAFELIRLGAGGQWRDGDRVDASTAHELAIVYALDDAAKAVEVFRWMERQLSEINLRVVIRVLRERQGFAQVAREIGAFGERRVAEVAFRFRDALETLAEKGVR